MKRKCVAALLVMFSLLISGCGAFNLPQEAKVLKVYSELPEDVTNSLVKDFEKIQNGKVKVEVKQITPQKLQQKLNYLKTTEGDVWLGGSAEDYFFADDRKMLKPYQAKDLHNVPLGLREKHGTWTGLYTTNLSFIANKNCLLELDAEKPESWDDLLSEKFSRNIVISDPLARQGGYRMLTTVWQLLGEKKFNDYTRFFKQQEAIYVESDETAVEEVTSGNKAVAVVPLDLAMAAAVRHKSIVISMPAEGTSRKLTGVAIMDSTKQELNSRLFVDYLLSKRAKEVLDNSEYYVWPLTDAPKDYTWGKQYTNVFLVRDDLRWCVLSSEEIAEKLKPTESKR